MRAELAAEGGAPTPRARPGGGRNTHTPPEEAGRGTGLDAFEAGGPNSGPHLPAQAKISDAGKVYQINRVIGQYHADVLSDRSRADKAETPRRGRRHAPPRFGSFPDTLPACAAHGGDFFSTFA